MNVISSPSDSITTTRINDLKVTDSAKERSYRSDIRWRQQRSQGITPQALHEPDYSLSLRTSLESTVLAKTTRQAWMISHRCQ
jgi:hypothetical protein